MRAAYKRLYALRYAREYRCYDERYICHHTICRHARISAYTVYYKVKDEYYYGGRELLYERRKPERYAGTDYFCRGLGFYQFKIVAAADKVHGRHAYSYHGRKPRGKYGAEHSHIAGEDKDIVEQYV